MPSDTTEIENRVRRILLDSPFAVLATAGEDSRPFVRWMSPIFAAGSLKRFHVLAAPNSRKVAQIRKNPRVAWVFASAGYEETVSLHGTATVEDDPLLRAEIWERMPDRQRAFILQCDENLQFAVIETEVEWVEYLRPKEGQTEPVRLEP